MINRIPARRRSPVETPLTIDSMAAFPPGRTASSGASSTTRRAAERTMTIAAAAAEGEQERGPPAPPGDEDRGRDEDDREHDEQRDRPLREGEQSLGVLQRRLGVGQPFAAVDDELAEVVREVAPDRRFEGGDLFGGVTFRGELGELDVRQHTELLHLPEGPTDQRQRVEGDDAIGDIDPVGQPVTLEEFDGPGVRPLDKLARPAPARPDWRAHG